LSKAIHVLFSGIVQGVGFRFMVKTLALELNISGWVKNLSDGRVEITAAGKSQDLVIFLERINERFKENISDCLSTKDGESLECSGFRIID